MAKTNAEVLDITFQHAYPLPQSLNPFALEARGISLLHCTSFHSAE